MSHTDTCMPTAA